MHLMKVKNNNTLGRHIAYVHTYHITYIHAQRAGPDAPIDELDANGCTALMYATMADSRLAVEMLLNFSAKREKVIKESIIYWGCTVPYRAFCSMYPYDL